MAKMQQRTQKAQQFMIAMGEFIKNHKSYNHA